MHFEHPQAHLSKHRQDIPLLHKFTILTLYKLLQVTALGVLHNDAKFVAGGLVDLLESDDVRVVE